jgi:hypothetical protein
MAASVRNRLKRSDIFELPELHAGRTADVRRFRCRVSLSYEIDVFGRDTAPHAFAARLTPQPADRSAGQTEPLLTRPSMETRFALWR